MANTMTVLVGGYRVERDPGGRLSDPARYTVYRPDGSLCCRAVAWPDVERAIDADLRSRPPQHE